MKTIKICILILLLGGLISGCRKNDPTSSIPTLSGPIVDSAKGSLSDGRCFASAVVFNNKIWLIGGTSLTSVAPNIWSSSDGVNWKTDTSNENFTGQRFPATVVFNNRLWLITASASGVHSAVWSTSDGKNWIEDTTNTGFTLGGYYSVVFNDKMWALGTTGVWSSSDGENWTEESTQSFSGGYLVLQNNKMCIVYGDVYSSSDGQTWTNESTTSGNFPGRTNCSVVSYNNLIWIIAGYSYNNNYLLMNDVWSSSDGNNWTEQISDGGFVPREWPTLVVFNNNIWFMGGWGFGGNGIVYSDIWKIGYQQ